MLHCNNYSDSKRRFQPQIPKIKENRRKTGFFATQYRRWRSGCVAALAALAVGLAFSSPAVAAPKDDLRRANKAYKASNLSAFDRAAPRLQNGAFAPLAGYWRALLLLRREHPQAVIDFIEATGSSYFADSARAELLRYFARRDLWESYERHLAAAAADFSPPACAEVLHRVRAAKTAENIAFVKNAWFGDKLRGALCSRAYRAARRAGLLDDDDLWRKLRATAGDYKLSAARRVLRIFPDLVSYRKLRNVARNARRYVAAKHGLRTRAERELVIVSAMVAARLHPDLARQRWLLFAPHFSSAENDSAWRAIGIWSAKWHKNHALDSFRRARDSAFADETPAIDLRARRGARVAFAGGVVGRRRGRGRARFRMDVAVAAARERMEILARRRAQKNRRRAARRRVVARSRARGGRFLRAARAGANQNAANRPRPRPRRRPRQNGRSARRRRFGDCHRARKSQLENARAQNLAAQSSALAAPGASRGGAVGGGKRLVFGVDRRRRARRRGGFARFALSAGAPRIDRKRDAQIRARQGVCVRLDPARKPLRRRRRLARQRARADAVIAVDRSRHRPPPSLQPLSAFAPDSPRDQHSRRQRVFVGFGGGMEGRSGFDRRRLQRGRATRARLAAAQRRIPICWFLSRRFRSSRRGCMSSIFWRIAFITRRASAIRRRTFARSSRAKSRARKRVAANRRG